MEVNHVDDQDEESDDEDEIRNFRRVQNVQGNPQQEFRPTHVPTLNDVSGQSTSHSPNEQDAHNVSQGASEHPETSTNGTEISEVSPDQTQQQRNIFASTDVPIERPINFAVPKLDRTMNGVCSDELYDTNFVGNTSSSSKANQASIYPPSKLFAQRLQAAKDHHLTSRSNPSLPTPFKTGSPLTSAHQTLFVQPSDVRYTSVNSMADNWPFMGDTPGLSNFDYGEFDFYVSPSGP